MNRVNLLILSLLIVPLLISFSEYYLLSPEQVNAVIDATLPIFSLTSIAFALKKTGNIGYGYFWVYSLSYMVFYFFWILTGFAIAVSNPNSRRPSKAVTVKVHIICLLSILGGFTLCFMLREPYLDNAAGFFKPRVSGILLFTLVMGGIGFFSSLYVFMVIFWFKDISQRKK
jgi:hypothetical protein